MAWRVADGSAMVAAIAMVVMADMAARRKMEDFFLFFVRSRS